MSVDGDMFCVHLKKKRNILIVIAEAHEITSRQFIDS